MVVSGWKSGEFLTRRAVALGVRVGRENVERFFDKDWKVVLIKVDSETIPVNITKAFWNTYPELRSPAIGEWMRKKGLVPWPEGRPPEMQLIPSGGNRFRLELCTKPHPKHIHQRFEMPGRELSVTRGWHAPARQTDRPASANHKG